MPKELMVIDGSLLEGGGQILRIAVSLSCLTQTPIRITKIRSGRSKPGLMDQHLKGIELVSKICTGKLKGAQIGSTEIELWPGKIKGGTYQAFIKTAGSISLLLQVALPCALFADSSTTFTLVGGTNAEMAPQIDYTTEVFRPNLEKFGGTFDFDLIKRGYFPKGGGSVVVNVKPVLELNSVVLVEMGEVSSVHGWSFVAGALPDRLASVMAKSAESKLKRVCSKLNIQVYKESREVAPDNCVGIVLVAETTTNCILGSSALGKRNVRAEHIGEMAADQLIKSIEQKTCLDEYAQDQVIILMALAKGRSRIRVGKVTLHTETAIFVTEQLTGVKFDIIQWDGCCIIECTGIGLKS